MDKKMLSLQVHNMKFEVSNEKPNWMPFTGVCLFTDVPSDGIPCSNCGIDKPVMFPKDEVEKSLSTFENMGVNCVWDEWGNTATVFSGHDARKKIGVMTSASVEDNKVVIKGGLWSWDFDDICDMVKVAKESLGWSVEVSMNIEETDEYYIAKDLEFSGVALLFADGASFSKTSIAAQKRKGVEKMTEEELKKMLDAQLEKFNISCAEKITEAVKGVNDAITSFTAKFEAEKKAELELKAKAEEEKAELELAAKEKEEADRVAAELAAKKALEDEPARKTVAFGHVISKFDGADDEEKAIMSDEKLDAHQKFRKVIDLRCSKEKK